MAIPPSSNIPTLQDIQEQYRKAAERARGRDVAAPFAAATGEMGRSQAMQLEALNRQQIQGQRQQQAMAWDTGIEMLGGNMAGEQRFRDAVERVGQQHNQAAAQLGIQQAKAQQALDAQADAMDLQATGVGAQFAAMQRKEQAQMQLAQYEAAQRQLARDLQERLANARTDLEKRQLKQQANQFASQLKQRAREAAEQIATSQQRRGALGGGGGMTANYSTGAAGFQDHLKRMGVMRG